MKKHLLEAKMKEHMDTGATLAKALSMSRTTFSAKKNNTNGSEFNQGEILIIKIRYNLTPEEVDDIFFSV